MEFEDLPGEVREALETLELVMMEGGDPIAVLGPIAKRYPGFVPARLNLASMHLNNGDIKTARSIYEGVAKDFPDALGAIAGLATVLAEEGELDRAAVLAGDAIEGGYEWPACYEVIAKAKENRGYLQGAADAYLAGYRISPHSWNFLQEYCRLTQRPFTSPMEEVEPCISLKQLDELATYVDEMANTSDANGEAPGCNHTFRFAEEWAARNSVDVIDLYQFLNANGGFCDCEICFNVTELLIDEEE